MTTQRTPSKLRLALLFAVATVLALSAGYWTSEFLLNRQADLSDLQATHFSEARALQPFELVDHTGKAFTNNELEGHWSFIFFGYTHCPDVCPTTLSVLNSVATRLHDQPDPLRYIFISVDPERDTPDKMGQFVSYFNADFIGVTGTTEAITKLTQQLGVIAARVENKADVENYLIDHTASILLIDPDGRFHALFSPPLKAADIASDFIRIAQAY
ncbi:MAG: SCO family protein [Halobacteria archaeon]|nr:SCO family protein [Halobacteria archaeon]